MMGLRAFSARPKPADLAILLLALPLLVYLGSGPVFYGYDGELMYRVSESLVTRHSIAITDPIYHYSQPYAPYGLGTSLALLPLVALGQWLLHDPRALVILYLPLVTALTVVALNAALVELGIARGWAAAVAVIYAFGTLAWHYSGVLFSEPLLSLSMMAALLGLLRFKRTAADRWLLLAGIALAGAVLAREDSLLLVVPPFIAYAAVLIVRRPVAVRQRLGHALVLLAPLTAGGGLALLYHLVRFGLGSGPYASDGMGFAQPLLSGLYGLLLSPGAGLLVYVPVLLVAFAGFPRLARGWRLEAALIAAVVLLRLLFFARWWDWPGGATWGPRYIVPLIPLMLLPAAFVAGRWRSATIALGLLGAGIEVLDLLVPYGLYYGWMAPRLSAELGICSCVPAPGEGSRAVHNLMAFNWQDSPLAGQLQLLWHGVTAPAWGPMAWVVMPVLAIVAIGIGLQIRRLAMRLTSPENPDPALRGRENPTRAVA